MGRHSEGEPPRWGLIRGTHSFLLQWLERRQGTEQREGSAELVGLKPEGSALVLSLAEDTDAVRVPHSINWDEGKILHVTTGLFDMKFPHH